MSMFLSFLGGGARQLTADIEKAEENAREDAKLGFSALTKRYEENAKANRELTSKMSEDALWVKTNYQNATPDQINALVANPVALEALKKTNDPYKIDLNNYIKIAQGNDSPAVAAERIQALPSVVGQVKTNMEERMKPTEGGSPLGRLLKDYGDTSYTSTMERMAKSQGMSMSDLQATSRVQRPTTNAQFNMAAIDTPKDIKEVKDKAEIELYNAKDSGDPKAIASATEKVARVVAIEQMSKIEKKTDAQIQSDMVTEIQAKQKAGDKQGAALTETLLRQRQALMKVPGAEGKTDADKISQANLIQTATRTRATTIEQVLPPGQLITSTDPQGNVTMTLRDLTQGDLFRKGDAIASNAIIKEMTKPDGTPRSEMHKNAMMSAGIRFDDSGKAIKPVVPEISVKGSTSSSTRGGATPKQATPSVQPTAPTAPTAPAQPTASTKPVLRYNPKTGNWE